MPDMPTLANMEEHCFKFSARILQHLGGELISSDDTALYELVKNGFDAGSGTVEIRIQSLVEFDLIGQLSEVLQADERLRFPREDALDLLRESFGPRLAPFLPELERSLPQEGTKVDFADAVQCLNHITVSDTGCGMTREELLSHFLTVGTPNRLHQIDELLSSEDQEEQIILGEKGIGRLSAMRLGRRLRVFTKSEEDSEWRVEINWDAFSEPDLEADQIPIQLAPTDRERDPGTQLTVFKLSSEWSRKKAESLASHFFSRFIDPFERKRRFQVRIYWNDELINIPRIGRQFLDAAQNCMEGRVYQDESGNFRISVKEKFTTPSGIVRNREVEYTELDLPDMSDADLQLAGPFRFEMYHYNRRRVTAIPGVATRREVLDWLDEWCGGMKVYRDGVRVLPYGQMGRESSRTNRTERINESYDDWLGIDDKALRARGFTLNRIQTVGCVKITRRHNPHLRDQANRQGLMENRAFGVFQDLLMQLIVLFRMDMMEALDTTEDDLDEIAEKSIQQEEEFASNTEEMIEAISSGDKKQIRKARDELIASVKQLRTIIDETQTALEDRDFNRVEVLELAGLGLSAQSFAHDLEASIDEVLANPMMIDSHLKSVFKALRVQVALIKPGAAKKRRRRSNFSVSDVLTQIKKYHESRLKRHGIELELKYVHGANQARVHMVEGHFRQIIDNLIRNSLYWLPRKRSSKLEIPGDRIVITVDGQTHCLTVSDNGPGIAQQDHKWVFKQFNTRRKGGKGLGLHIARELAEFNGLAIELDLKATNPLDRLSTFAIELDSAWEG